MRPNKDSLPAVEKLFKKGKDSDITESIVRGLLQKVRLKLNSKLNDNASVIKTISDSLATKASDKDDFPDK